jgi:hypothetical protein
MLSGKERPARRNLWALLCRVYLGLGLLSVGLGLAIVLAPRWVGLAAPEAASIRFGLAGILIFFGLLRIGNALYQLRRLRR